VIKFTTLNDTLKFRYVFASEEFPPFNNHTVKDVFGFFITGESYTDKNLATFPGTTDIKIDSFANPPYNQYYVSNNPPGDTTAICFNGFTKVMTAICPVVPCKQYTLKIALGDATNKYYDSGLFLEAGSFSSTRKSVAVKGTNGDNGMVEKCGTAKFIFQRDYVTSSTEVLNFIIEGTAINGADYTDTLGNMVPSTITFPAYKKQAEIKVKAVDNDDPNEPTETIIFKIPGMTQCNDTVKAVLYLKNTKPISVIAGNDTTLCSESGETANLFATVTGGVEPYAYYWLEEQDNDTTGKIGEVVYVAKPTYDPKNEKAFYLYHVVVLDSCKTIIASNDVKVTIKCPIKTTNVITPNGDGYNDKFIIKHLIEYPNTKLVVLNRWGNKVFETNNYQNNWDADRLADGVYFYIIELPDGSKFQGSVTVLR
jgi:gliding motility-associated-like protein